VAKYQVLSDRLRHRITQGDYVLRALPPERQLAAEHGVSYMTARRATQQLVEEQILVRGANGRLEVNSSTTGKPSALPVALISPAFHSHGYDGWRDSLARAAAQLNRTVRQVLYTHWDDPLFVSSLDGFGGIFLLPSSEPMPRELVARLAESKSPVVILDGDLSGLGLPSIRPFPPGLVEQVLDHLKSRGFKVIDCLNTQPCHDVVEAYIGQYQVWQDTHSCLGALINDPVEPYGDPRLRAFSTVAERLSHGELQCDALFCVTMPAAVGAMRALHEAGLQPGKDIGVCTINGEGVAPFQIPSLTAFDVPEIEPFVLNCIHWMGSGGGPWQGPLLMEPTGLQLQVRESTLGKPSRSPI